MIKLENLFILLLTSFNSFLSLFILPATFFYLIAVTFIVSFGFWGLPALIVFSVFYFAGIYSIFFSWKKLIKFFKFKTLSKKEYMFLCLALLYQIFVVYEVCE